MTIFLILFFIYIVLRLYFRERQKRAGEIFMIASRLAVLPEHVRIGSIVAMTGIALIVILLTISGYNPTTDQIAHILAAGIVILAAQYLPMCMIGSHGIVSVDVQIDWNDISSVEAALPASGSPQPIVVGYTTAGGASSIRLYIHQSQVEGLMQIVREYSSVSTDNRQIN
jgi:hypothetical protein